MTQYAENPRNKTRMSNEQLQKAYDAHMEWLDHLTDTGCGTDIGKQMVLESENLTDCDFFREKFLGRVIFRNCILDYADFYKADLDSALIQDCRLNETYFKNANLTCSIINCSGNHTQFQFSHMLEAELENLRIYDGDFRNCYLDHAKITGGELGKLEKCNFGAIHANNSQWDGLELKRCDFTWATMIGAELRKCRTDHSIFKEVDLKESDLQDCYFDHCEFKETELDNATLKGCEFFDCALNRVNFPNTNILNTSFDLSSFPLWCGAFHAKPDDRLAAQLLYHLIQFRTDNMTGGMKEAIEHIRQMAASELFPEYRDDLPK